MSIDNSLLAALKAVSWVGQIASPEMRHETASSNASGIVADSTIPACRGKKLILHLLLILGLSLLSPFQTVASHWKEYSSREGKLTVLLPGTPTTGYRPINADSPTSVTYVINLQTPKASYIIAYFDLPTAPTEAKATEDLLDRTRDFIRKMYSVRITNDKGTNYAGYPGRDLEMTGRSQETLLTKIIVVKQRVYHLTIAFPPGQADPSPAAKFFDSFRVTPLTDEELKSLKSSSPAENQKSVPHLIRFGEGVLEGKAIKKVQPEYPPEAKAAGVSGMVEVKVTVSEQGQVIKAEAIKGPVQLRRAAIEAAKQWAFKPLSLGGYPVQSRLSPPRARAAATLM